MRFLLLALLLPLTATAAKIKVVVPDLEDKCEALLDTKKMSKAEYDRIAELLSHKSIPSDPLGFLKDPAEIKKAREEVKENLELIEASVKKIPSFKRAPWKKLGEHLLAEARAKEEEQTAALNFMETWNPAPLLDPKESAEIGVVSVRWEDGMDPAKLTHYEKEAKQKILNQPLEERDPFYLKYNQRLQILADESKLEKFSAKFGKYECSNNGNPAECAKTFLITPGMPRAEREGKRMYLFQWAWYNNRERPYVNGKTKPSEYEGPGLDKLLRSALSGEKCEDIDSCPEG